MNRTLMIRIAAVTAVMGAFLLASGLYLTFAQKDYAYEVSFAKAKL